MSLDIDGTVIACAWEVGNVRWEVSNRPGLFDRNLAITATVLAEQLTAGPASRTRALERQVRTVICADVAG
jgi:hypothetical protein